MKIIRKSLVVKSSLLTVCVSGSVLINISTQHDSIQPLAGKIAKTLDGTQQAWTERTKAPKDAPNVLEQETTSVSATNQK